MYQLFAVRGLKVLLLSLMSGLLIITGFDPDIEHVLVEEPLGSIISEGDFTRFRRDMVLP